MAILNSYLSAVSITPNDFFDIQIHVEVKSTVIFLHYKLDIENKLYYKQ